MKVTFVWQGACDAQLYNLSDELPRQRLAGHDIYILINKVNRHIETYLSHVTPVSVTYYLRLVGSSGSAGLSGGGRAR